MQKDFIISHREIGYGLTIGEQKNPIQNVYNPLLKEFRHMLYNFIWKS